MLTYLAHIATFLGLAVLAGGFIGLHFAHRSQSSQLRVAGFILVIGGILGLSCILYYSLKYWRAGSFEFPAAMMMPHSPEGAPAHSNDGSG